MSSSKDSLGSILGKLIIYIIIAVVDEGAELVDYLSEMSF